MIQLTNITKDVTEGKARVSILRNIDLQVAAGEFLSIMGPSGSGKSTLLNLLGLLDKPTSGKYFLAGMDTRKLGGIQLAALRNERIGFVFQSFMLIPRLSVKENVEVPLLYTNLSRKERKQRIEQALEQVGMTAKAKEPIINLSGGQKQKVAIARAIINEPELLLADEPTGNLDSVSKEEVLQIFRHLHAKGKTIVMVTHDHEVAKVAQRKLEMKDGEWR
jgi:putative ABC transport system ATP-binding protein